MTEDNAFSASLDAGLSGATRLYFIVGDPIAQVRSPAGVTAALRAAGRDAIVVPAHVAPDDLPAFFAAVTAMRNVDGVIITVPHKFSAAQYLRVVHRSSGVPRRGQHAAPQRGRHLARNDVRRHGFRHGTRRRGLRPEGASARCWSARAVRARRSATRSSTRAWRRSRCATTTPSAPTRWSRG